MVIGKAYDVVKVFEQEVAHWAGAKYGVAVSSCCNAIFLSLVYHGGWGEITLPKRTYPGVATAVVNTGYDLDFEDLKWEGIYKIKPLQIIDSALRFREGMYIPNTLYCLSFHYKKHLPIGRGGMILTDDKKAVDWLKMMRFDGRKEVPLNKDNISLCGYNMYMTPEQAARGLVLFEQIKDKKLPDLKVKEQGYPDLSKWRVFE